MINDSNNDAGQISIKLASPIEIGKPIIVNGKFEVSYDRGAVSAIGSQVLKHIVLVVNRGGNYFADTAFKNTIVFADDVIEMDSGCKGAFSFNIFDKVNFDGNGDYYVMCSLGSLASNIIYMKL